MVMDGVYNAETLEKLSITIYKMHITTTPNEVLFANKLGSQFTWYLTKNEVNQYAINSLLYLRTLQQNISKCMKNSSHSYACMLR